MNVVQKRLYTNFRVLWENSKLHWTPVFYSKYTQQERFALSCLGGRNVRGGGAILTLSDGNETSFDQSNFLDVMREGLEAKKQTILVVHRHEALCNGKAQFITAGHFITEQKHGKMMTQEEIEAAYEKYKEKKFYVFTGDVVENGCDIRDVKPVVKAIALKYESMNPHYDLVKLTANEAQGNWYECDMVGSYKIELNPSKLPGQVELNEGDRGVLFGAGGRRVGLTFAYGYSVSGGGGRGASAYHWSGAYGGSEKGDSGGPVVGLIDKANDEGRLTIYGGVSHLIAGNRTSTNTLAQIQEFLGYDKVTEVFEERRAYGDFISSLQNNYERGYVVIDDYANEFCKKFNYKLRRVKEWEKELFGREAAVAAQMLWIDPLHKMVSGYEQIGGPPKSEEERKIQQLYKELFGYRSLMHKYQNDGHLKGIASKTDEFRDLEKLIQQAFDDMRFIYAFEPLNDIVEKSGIRKSPLLKEIQDTFK